MKCERCHEYEAEVRIETHVDGHVKELRLCRECAAMENEFSRPDGQDQLSLSQLLSGLVRSEHGSEDEVSVCPGCGLKSDEFYKFASLGCPECYTAFSEDINLLLKNMGGSCRHAGKIPKHLAAFKTLVQDRENLKLRLDRAVKEEDYETAAALRDRLKHLEEESHG